MRLFTHLHITGLLSFCICMFISLNANVSANNFTKESFNLFELTQINVQNDSTEEDLLNDFFLSKYLRFFDREYRESPAGSMYFQERGGLQGEIPFYSNPDSVYKARLGGLSKNCVVKLPFNDKVRNYIDVYVNKRRKQVNVMLALSQYYFPIFEDALLTNGVPTELKYLAIIESALNPKAMSRMGASGLWQFMYQTGRMYDLKITTKVDERYDPVKASNAAARYLKDLYNSFGDWTLAIAAYNCGPGNVNKAIRKAKGKTDFWEIYPFLPKETRGYVPAFIGATYVMNYYKEHGFYPPQNSMPILTDTLMVEQDLDMKIVAENLNIPIQVLRDLNPQYKQDIIPGKPDYFSLRLPVNFVISFLENKDSIYADSNGVSPIIRSDNVSISYRIKSRETLSGIAQRFGVSVANLMKWNELRSTTIYPNQILHIYTSQNAVNSMTNKPAPSKPTTTTTPANENHVSITTTKPKAPKPTPIAASSNSNSNNTNTNTNTNTIQTKQVPEETKAEKDLTHIVKKGETLYSISRKYPGSNIEEIIKTNNLPRKGSLIYPKQVLKINVH